MPTPSGGPPPDLQDRLASLMLRDERALRRRVESLARIRSGAKRAAAYDALASQLERAEARVGARRAAVPTIRYPEELPVSQRRDDLIAAIRDHQVVVVAGETGSGKTTQLPKICLELGRGVRGMIGHTQPRRLAARTVADRIAQELGSPLGTTVGYSVRFSDHVSDTTLVKLMTDGILLAELAHDRLLERYDTVIVDEAHERSLNIDFILGYLKTLLPRRPDLKVVITSATIDPERLSQHFDGAPVVEVSGRTYPVQVRYRPLVEEGDGQSPRRRDSRDSHDSGDGSDVVVAITDAVDELCAEGPGDILVFLSGEREIRDTADALRKHAARRATAGGRGAGGFEVLPLYARLSAAEQHRVFAPHAGRRVVLATNVAETSLTVPGIHYVIDPGTARISRYSHRLKVQRLPIEAISQASADQRKGRCGRVAEGVCIRLYAEDDFAARPRFTDPEILRTNLASVILAMAALGLGDVAAFPFLDPPDGRAVRDGIALLEELGALKPATGRGPGTRLTPLGRRLAALPIDPRLARMVLEAEHNGCVQEVLVIAAGLSIQDPRERPVEHQQAADERHRRFADPASDFLAYLNLWTYLQEQQRALSSNAFRRLCKAEFLHYLRVREWQDLVAQLRRVVRSLGIRLSSAPAEPERIHRSLLAGLLSHLGTWDPDKREYAGARGARFAPWPGSALAKKPPRMVMAGELVETSRLWGRDLARIEPEWAEALAGHLVKRNYSEPHWEARRGAVVALEKVTLFGVPLVVSRKVGYAKVDPGLCRELFIRHALVEGDWRTHHRFFHDNQALLAEVEELENRVRRRDLVVDDETLFDFYDQRIPDDVVSARHFDAWWKAARRQRPDLLHFARATVASPEAEQVERVRAHDFPDEWAHDDLRLPLSYAFEPGAETDGITVAVPVSVLNRLQPDAFLWSVPGLRVDLVTALIRALPKPVRRHLAPAPDHARALVARIDPGDGPLLDVLAREIRRMTGVSVPPDSWDLDRVPAHLRPTVRVVDESGATLAAGKDVEALQHQLKAATRTAIASVVDDVERSGLRAWTIGALPRVVRRTHHGQQVTGYPALVDEGDAVAVRLLGSPLEQEQAMPAGTRRLLLLGLPSPAKAVLARLDNSTKLALSHSPYPSVPALFNDCVAAAVDALVAEHGGPAWDQEAFAKLADAVRPQLPDASAEIVILVATVLSATRALQARLAAMTNPASRPVRADVHAQLSALVGPGFVAATGRRRLGDLPRYLRAIEHRLDKAGDLARDQARARRVQQVQEAYDELLGELPPAARAAPPVREVRWMLEELRVSLFAQTLGTAYPVSEPRIMRVIDDLRQGP